MHYNLFAQGYTKTEYSEESAMVIAKSMNHNNYMLIATNSKNEYLRDIWKDLKQFGDKGYDAAFNKI
jgi:flagellar biosynthesis GTPase FlhF